MPNDSSQVIDYGRESRRPFPWRRFLRTAGVVLAITAVTGSVVWYAYLKPWADRHQCANTLRRAVAFAIQMYQEDHRKAGVNAPNLQTLALEWGAPPELFSCPAGGTPATMNNPYSYIYVAASTPVNAPPTAIWVLEDPANHGMTGGHVVFADGHVEFVPLTQLMPYFNDLAAGRNPPTSLAATTSAAYDDYKQHWQFRMPQMKTGVWAIPATQPAR